MARPFEGLRVIDATHVLAGPFAAYQLAVLGADVIRIDHPGDPDQSRSQGADRALNAAQMGSAYLAQGGGKRSLALDLKQPEGQAALLRLLCGADVFVQNFRPGALEALGLGYDAVSRINPRLVYCSISAFGQDGPRAQDTGYDNVFQAMSGMMSLTGTEASGPLRAGAPVVDYATGYMAGFAIAAALVRRAQTGEGAHVDLAMFDAALMLMAAPISGLTAGGAAPGPQGNRFPSAGLGAYPTADGLLMLGAGNQRQQRRLWAALGHPEMAKATHDESRDDFEREEALLRRIFLTRSAADWEEMLRGHRVPAARVRSLPEALADPQLAARAVMQSAGPLPGGKTPHAVPVAPFGLTGGDPVLDRPAPRIGEHSEEVLREAGFTPAEIAALQTSGALG
ncbi:CoA transferase [Salipiger manganoxidans]|uniref:CaiB/BaiF CoA transferase family protein n=1 Tax=Salipiger marinus TaxID=555512 RepID=UPI001E382874|nr:CoA transferase [Salipiger manganoxidans]MCD1619331.1 CoA transferase [Salipiger manganoxidans]